MHTQIGVHRIGNMKWHGVNCNWTHSIVSSGPNGTKLRTREPCSEEICPAGGNFEISEAISGEKLPREAYIFL